MEEVLEREKGVICMASTWWASILSDVLPISMVCYSQSPLLPCTLISMASEGVHAPRSHWVVAGASARYPPLAAWSVMQGPRETRCQWPQSP